MTSAGGLSPMPLDLMIALVCITSHANLDAPPAPLWAFQSVAIQLELMDSRESHYYFARPADFDGDLKSIRSRAESLEGAPPLLDAQRFPDADFCRDGKDFNCQYRQYLQDLRLIDRSAWIEEALAEADELYRAWDLACDAARDYYFVAHRRA